MCARVDRYFEVQRAHPDLLIPGPKSSLIESWRCGCRICSVGCQVMGYVGDIESNTNSNDEAATQNSDLPLFSSGRGTGKETLAFEAEFRGSGLVFKRKDSFEEVFVVDSTL
jgi:hypothetical protein